MARRALVRPAYPEDLFGIKSTLMAALTDAPPETPDPDWPYAYQMMLDLIAQGLVFVAVTPSNAVVGCIALNYARMPWVHPDNTQKAHLQNDHFWVDPMWRGFGTATKLIDAAKARAYAIGRPLVLEISYGGDDVALKDRFVESHGFTYVGGKFTTRAPQEPETPVLPLLFSDAV